ncbi:MAG: 2-oxoacid:acceptor oxidoreductase family protein, partial [Armatimonadota bacterium]|nr:2-oxoacid:acceptor oxidoreductase family protein [Armatimonadota bacterium]
YALYRSGYNPHGQPRYTPDRMGAPVSYAIRFRANRSRIFDRSWIRHPRIVVLFDLTLLQQLGLAATWNPGITVVANARPDDPRLEELAAFRVARVDADRIARDLNLMKGSVPILSTAMSGAFARVSGLLTLEEICASIREAASSAVGRDLPANLEAARRGYHEVGPIPPAPPSAAQSPATGNA